MRLGCVVRRYATAVTDSRGPWLEPIEILSKRPKLFHSVRAMVQAQHVQPYKTLVYMDTARGQNRSYPRFFRAAYGSYPRVYCRTGRKTPQLATDFRSLVPSMRVFFAPSRLCVSFDTLFPAWFNFSVFAGDKSWVAGVELATDSEPPARKPRS
jgi:hypothetical protein